MSKYTPVHYARQDTTVTEWAEQYTGQPVELADQAAADLNAQFKNTGVKYVAVADKAPGTATTLPGNSVAGADKVAATAPTPGGAGTQTHEDNLVRDLSGAVVTGHPEQSLVVTDQLLAQFKFPANITAGMTIDIAASGYVYAHPAAAKPGVSSFAPVQSPFKPVPAAAQAGEAEHQAAAGAAQEGAPEGQASTETAQAGEAHTGDTEKANA